jgi:hypothetical protein
MTTTHVALLTDPVAASVAARPSACSIAPEPFSPST